MNEIQRTLPIPQVESFGGLVVASVVGGAPGGFVEVLLPGDSVATTAPVAWLPIAPRWDACRGLRVLVGFLNGAREQPIVVGLMEAPPAAEGPLTDSNGAVRLNGKEELVLECGKARVALRADGRVEIRGGYLLSRSSGPNKIRGATVEVN